MCGIAGVISWNESRRTSRATLARMSAAIAHRGPDGEGFYFDRDPDDPTQLITPDRPQVAFAFRRLAVLDPTPCSDQPFVSTDGRYVLVFNGEIYNFRELREELSKLHPEYVWRSKGDTEVLMQSFAEWSERCVERLNGMFAFAVWDHQERSLFLARDRMGQKPLYVAAANSNDWFMPSELRLDQHESVDTIAFASEPAALSAVLPAGPTVEAAIQIYLARGTVPWGVSEGFGAIDIGSTATFSQRSATERRYWNLRDGARVNAGRSARAVDASGIGAAVRRSVERQLVADVPLGVFLSGGVDSSVIAACARAHGRVQTFSIGFDDPRYDESGFAREVAKHLATDHHEFRVTPNVIDDLPKLAAVFGVPFADSSALPTHYLARETRKHVTVALSGDGGDELFGGYDRYIAMRRAALVPWPMGLVIAPIARGLAGGHPKSRVARAARFGSTLSMSAGERYDTLTRVFDDALIAELTGAEVPWYVSIADLFEQEQERTRNVVTAALAADRITYLPDDLLTKVDRCSMLHGLEVRSPFMDHELVELAAQLTEDQLLKGGKKRMLREAFADDLPDFVFKRPKMGFAVPIGEWFRGPLRSFLRDHLFAADSFARAHFKMPIVERFVEEHETQRRDHSQRLYALLMLELWWDVQNPMEGVTP